VTLAIIMAGIAIFISSITCFAVLALLGRKQPGYPQSADEDDTLARLVKNQAVLWKALEDMDDRLDDAGLSVLRPWVQDDQAKARH
jgi:hypothetical protein